MRKFKIHIDGQIKEGEKVKIEVNVSGQSGDLAKALAQMMEHSGEFKNTVFDACMLFIESENPEFFKKSLDEAAEAIQKKRVVVPTGPAGEA